MLRRVFLAAPVLLLFGVISVIFMEARTPRTWAAHWGKPSKVAVGAGEREYAAVGRGGRRWDVLWVDDNTNRLVFTHVQRKGRLSSVTLDRGDVSQPTILRSGNYELGAWVHNYNGSTTLMAAILAPPSRPRVFRLLHGPWPIEHPYLFAGRGRVANLVVSWQRYGNYDVFLVSLPCGATRPQLVARLTHAQDYAFYPRAVVDRSNTIHLIYLDNCCQQQAWNVLYDRFTALGRQLGRPVRLDQLVGSEVTQALPSQWAEDIKVDNRGNIWGAFAGDGGAQVFEAGADGHLKLKPQPIDTNAEVTPALALGLDRRGGFLFWQQPFDLGSYIATRPFDLKLRPTGPVERVTYESAAESNPRVAMVGGQSVVLWQAVTGGLYSRFEEASYRKAVQPTLAQRLGLGLGNPWEELALLLVGAVSVAALATVGNLIVIIGLIVIGVLAVKVLARLSIGWVLYALLLTAALSLTFVAPGGPTLFLTTMPSMGLATIPFGLVAVVGALLFLLWMGSVVLKRVEDVYRASIMAVLGVYFFAFVEAIVFIQQRIGYI